MSPAARRIRQTVNGTRARARARVRLGLSWIRPYRPMQGGGELLDSEYRSGTWDYLVSDRELPRFSVVAGYCLRQGEGKRVLEIGCGEGFLPERLGTSRYVRFVGVDVSAAAIERAKAKGHPNATFVAEDASVFEPDSAFDVIVFNEVLEYFPDPLGLVRRYERFLSADGCFVVSQFRATENARTRKIWKMLHRTYTSPLRAQVTTAPRYTWNIEVLLNVDRNAVGR